MRFSIKIEKASCLVRSCVVDCIKLMHNVKAAALRLLHRTARLVVD